MSPAAKDIDAYLAALSEEQRAVLQKLRATIKAIAPEAAESISYGMPTFKYKGKPLIYLGAAKNHCALYGLVPDAYKDELKQYYTSKGTIRFSPDKPLPEELVVRLVKTRMAETDAGAVGYGKKAIRKGENMSQKITTFLTYNDQAEEAANLYTSIFPNSKILSMTRYGEEGPGPKGSVMTASFELDGQQFMALNGGPSFNFAEGISLFVNCETQEEIDELWEKLSEGGEKGPCGWLKDRFGVSWQVVPRVLGEMLGDKDPEKSKRVMSAMLQMSKIDISGLKQAYKQG